MLSVQRNGLLVSTQLIKSYVAEMGKHKKEHKEHKHKHRERSQDTDDPPVLIPKLIVKLGSSPGGGDRADSPAAPILEQLGGFKGEDDFHQGTGHHHHRHKDKKKKKKKDKKKSHEKDREHRHHHKSKKRKRDHSEAPDPPYSPEPPILPVYPPVNREVDQIPESGTAPSTEPALKRARLGSGDQCSLLTSPRRDVPSRTCVQKPTSPLNKILDYLLLMLEKKDLNNFFASPVNDTFAPGYSNIIKEPMDFSTMREKIEDSKYKSLYTFRYDFELICNNCMTYNLPDTVYYKTAKKLLQQGQRILAPERLRALAEHLPLIKELSKEELGFEISDEVPVTELSIEHKEDVSKYIEEIRGSVKRPPGKFEAIPDPLSPEDLAAQTKAAAKSAADKLVKRRVSGQMGYLKNRPDGSASLALITPDANSTTSNFRGEKPVTLAQLVSKVKNGTSTLTGFKEDRRNSAKTIHPLYYGAFSSHGPTHDSTFANLTKPETELVYSTYGDDVGVSYAESIKNFSRNCEYATFIVDHLLDILTDQQHRKTSKYIEEQKLLRQEESVVNEVFTDVKVDFDSLKSLEKDGIDMSFLGDLEKRYQGSSSVKLETNAGLLEDLRNAQHDRLSGSTNLNNLPEIGIREAEIAGQVQGNLVDMVGSLRPRDISSGSMAGLRRAMGMME